MDANLLGPGSRAKGHSDGSGGDAGNNHASTPDGEMHDLVDGGLDGSTVKDHVGALAQLCLGLSDDVSAASVGHSVSAEA